MKSALQYLLMSALCIINTHIMMLSTSDAVTKSEVTRYRSFYERLHQVLQELKE